MTSLMHSKSRTKGYASFDYELSGYKTSKLVKLDIMISGDVVDALSFIVHADRAYSLRTQDGRETQGEHPASDV